MESMLEPCLQTHTRTHTLHTLHHVAYLPDLYATCTPPHTHAHAALASRHCPHHHTCISIIYTCGLIQSCCQPHTHIAYGHTNFDAAPPSQDYSDTTHSCTAFTYLAAWMSGPLAYVSFPQTFAPSHRAQVGVDLEPCLQVLT